MSSDSIGRVFWALSHKTLLRSDVPALQAVGLEVIPEEPEIAVLRDEDLAAYPNTERDHGSALSMASRVRLWSRNGRIEQCEAQLFRQHFDAIVVGTRIDVAINVCEWFPGPVFFRYLGELAGVEMPPCPNAASVPSNLHFLPILRSLIRSPIGRVIPRGSVLESVIPVPPVEPRRVGPISVNRVGVFLGGYRGDALALLASLVAACRHDTTWIVLGCDVATRELIDLVYGGQIMTPGFLSDARYWEMVSTFDALVYPHTDPFHTHYTPYECALLGIPCVSCSSTPFGEETLYLLDDFKLRGAIVSTPSELGFALRELQHDGVLAETVATGQAAVAKARSFSSIRDHASAVAEIVVGARKDLRQTELEVQESRAVMTSARHLWDNVSWNAPRLKLQAAAIATAPVLGRGLDAVLEPPAKPNANWRLRLRPGTETWLRLGRPASRLLPRVESATVRVAVEIYEDLPESICFVVLDEHGRFVRREDMSSSAYGGVFMAHAMVSALAADYSVLLETRVGPGQNGVVLGDVVVEIHRDISCV